MFGPSNNSNPITMRLGTDTNSFTNYMLSGTKGQPTPEVGMGATVLCWSDRHAYTIVEVSAKRIGVQRDNASRVDGGRMSESQQYEYTPNLNATVEYFTLRKNGAWIKEGNAMKGGTQIRIGDRREYYDFSF